MFIFFIYENACIVTLETHKIIFIKNSFIFCKTQVCYSLVLAKEYFFFLSSISSSWASWTQRSNLRNAKLHFPLPARLNATLPFNARLITAANPALQRKVDYFRKVHPNSSYFSFGCVALSWTQGPTWTHHLTLDAAFTLDIMFVLNARPTPFNARQLLYIK